MFHFFLFLQIYFRHEDLKDVKTAAEGIARFMTTSSGDRYQAVEALDYEATHNPGKLRSFEMVIFRKFNRSGARDE